MVVILILHIRNQAYHILIHTICVNRVDARCFRRWFYMYKYWLSILPMLYSKILLYASISEILCTSISCMVNIMLFIVYRMWKLSRLVAIAACYPAIKLSCYTLYTDQYGIYLPYMLYLYHRLECFAWYIRTSPRAAGPRARAYMLGAICEFAQFINCAAHFVNW